MKKIQLGLLGVALALVAGCGGIFGGKEAGERAVKRFHELYNQNQMETIWEEAGGELHAGPTRHKQKQYLEAVRRKLGKATASSTTNWKVFQNNLKTTVHLKQETVFERGHGTESFVFSVSGTNAVVTSYQLESRDLALNDLASVASTAAETKKATATTPASGTTTNYTLANCFNTFDPAKTNKTGAGYQYWFVPQKFQADGWTVKLSAVGPHQATHAPHTHAGDEIFFVLEGTAQFYLDGKTTNGSAYSSFFCPENHEHGISNGGNTEMKYLVIRKYGN